MVRIIGASVVGGGLSVCPSVCLPVCLSVCQLVCWFVCLSTRLLVNRLVCVFVCPTFCSLLVSLYVGACACVDASACLCASICVYASACACAGVKCLGLVVPLALGCCCNSTAAPAVQQQHCGNTIAPALQQQQQEHWNTEECTNSWAIHATNSQSLVTCMVWEPWGPGTFEIYSFPCIINDEQTGSIRPKGSHGHPPRAPWGSRA